MKINSDIAPSWTWEKRLLLDQMTHKERCAHCRNPAKLKTDEFLYGVKNMETREFVHVVATTTDEAVSRLGWLTEDTWAMIADGGNKSGAPMSEATKQRLRAISAERRALRRPEMKPKVPPARHQHYCMKCSKYYVHTDRSCLREETRDCVLCDDSAIVEPNIGVLTGTARRGTIDLVAVDNSNEERKEEFMATKLAEFVKEFIEAQVMDKDKESDKMILNEKSLFDLAKANGVDAGGYRKEFKPENAGRIRMTIGNMIRGAAARNGKLITLGGASKMVPANLMPIKKEKAEPKAKAKAKKKAA